MYIIIQSQQPRMVLVRVLSTLLGIGQLGIAFAVIGLVAVRLDRIHVAWSTTSLGISVTDTCLMGTTPTGVNLCFMTYSLAGISILVTAALAVLRWCTCSMCGLGRLFDLAFAAAGTAW